MADSELNDPILPAAGTEPAGKTVTIERIYCKDASLEVPMAPTVFARNWSPQVDVQVNTQSDNLGDNRYHVTLSITITSKDEDQVIFLIEAQQAAIFEIRGFDSTVNELGAILGAYCPGVIFPFARETIASLVQHAGFPPFLLQPINFDAMYASQVANEQQQANQESSAGPTLN